MKGKVSNVTNVFEAKMMNEAKNFAKNLSESSMARFEKTSSFLNELKVNAGMKASIKNGNEPK